MAAPEPPMDVLIEFLRRLSATATQWDPVLVVRGSFLLRYWFGSRARPAADLDLECFERPVDRANPRFGSLVAHARALCLFATEDMRACDQDQGARATIEFTPIDPEDGTDLWDYGTPGERCFTLWVSHDLQDAQGRLQIDIAQAGSYDLEAIGTEELELSTSAAQSSESQSVRFSAYTPEMLLTAKLSWILRGLRGNDVASQPQWSGAPKDLFDAHLLLTQANLRTDELQKGLYAVGTEDQLDWLELDSLLEATVRMRDHDFGNWDEFRQQHAALIDCGPAELLRRVAERLKPLLGDFRDHLPFVREIKDDPTDEVAYLTYAEWLDSRADPRGHVLRLYIRWAFSPEKPMSFSLARRLLARMFGLTQERRATRQALLRAIRETPPAWRYHAFGGPDRYRKIMRQLGAS
jgi:uncharacterized protein (TIGR02996 family)